jgi:hypothetical protein
MEIEQLNFDFGKIEDKTFEDIKQKQICEKIDLKPEMFDYMIGDKSSLRFEWIKSIDDKDERIEQMTKLLIDILPKGFPEEFYSWYSREILGLQYSKYEIKEMKRKYKIQKKREQAEKKKQEKAKSKCLNYIKKKVVLTF